MKEPRQSYTEIYENNTEERQLQEGPLKFFWSCAAGRQDDMNLDSGEKGMEMCFH